VGSSAEYSRGGASRYSIPFMRVMPADGEEAARAVMWAYVVSDRACSSAWVPEEVGGTHRLLGWISKEKLYPSPC